MFSTCVPAPTVIYEGDLIWPFPQAARRMAVGDAWEQYGLRNGSVELPLLGAGGAMGLDARGQVYGRLDSDGAGGVQATGLGYARAYVPLYSTGLPGAYQNPAWYRVWRVQVGLRAAAVVPAVWSWAGWQPEGSFGAGGPHTNNTVFGIRGNGAGSWEYVCRNVAGAGVQERVPLGILQTEYVLWDFVILSGPATAPASFSLYANGALVLTRSWAAGTLLPLPTSGVANGSHFTFTLGAADAAVACALQLSSLRCQFGRFNVNGYGV